MQSFSFNGNNQSNFNNKNNNYNNAMNNNKNSNNSFNNINNVSYTPHQSMLLNNNLNSIQNLNNNRLFSITETETDIYVVNNLYFNTIKINKSNQINIQVVANKNGISNTNIKYADAIIGILDLNYIKYLGIVLSSEEVGEIYSGKIYLIKSIELINITNNKETSYYLKYKKIIKDFFSTKNFYYSNEYRLCVPLKESSRINQELKQKYLINYSLLKPFLDAKIPECLYSEIIFGFVSCKNNIDLGNYENTIDIIIIERYLNVNINISGDFPTYIKQVELITFFKNMKNNEEINIFSSVFYISSESVNNINKFVPFKAILVEELNQFKNVKCIVNNLNKGIPDKKISERIERNNKNLLNKKINSINFTSNWKETYFENLDLKDVIVFYCNQTIQENTLWFIDINNLYGNNLICFSSLMRLFWKIIKKEISYQEININIGDLNRNNEEVIFKEFNEMNDKYENNAKEFKRNLFLNTNKNKNQEIIDSIFNVNNNILAQNMQIEQKFLSNYLNIFKLLCITWNLGGIDVKNDYDISEVFTKNNFYFEQRPPELVIISFQEMNKSINKKNLMLKIKKTLNSNFSGQSYADIIQHELNGQIIMIFGSISSLPNFLFSSTKENKSKDDKNIFCILSFKYFDKSFSIVSAKFNYGVTENKKRLEALKLLLKEEINVGKEKDVKLKDSDFWIILGALNFRNENMNYDDSICLIQEKNYRDLMSLDQFNYEHENDIFLKNNLTEGIINFDPSYKYELNSDEYSIDEVPSYCDRIFFCKKNDIRILSYTNAKKLKLSCHRPIIGAFEVICNKKNSMNTNQQLNINC